MKECVSAILDSTEMTVHIDVLITAQDMENVSIMNADVKLDTMEMIALSQVSVRCVYMVSVWMESACVMKDI